MMMPLLKHQNPSGLWRQLVDKPDAWEETSGSGMFAYAIVTGVKRGWLDEQTYGPVGRKAWLALVHSLDEKGNLTNVCVGTNKAAKEVGTDLDAQYAFYLARERVAGDYHGQAALLWTAAALLEK
jgi:rhamnogalacturonyl hydrolase YesR